MNMNCKVLLTLTLYAASYFRAAARLITKPRDTDVKVNGSSYFNCSTDSSTTALFWFHGAKYVYTGSILEPYHERFKVDANVRNGTYIYNLVIHSAQPVDAGEYICADDEGFGEKYSVKLVVLDNDPICRSNIELNEIIGQNTCNIQPDEVELECSVTYHGKIPPRMEWKKVGENNSTPLEVVFATSRNNFITTLKLRGDIALNNSTYVCQTNRTTQEQYKCTSDVITILYAISDNSTVNKTIDEEIHCNANTSQSCTYKWKWLQDNDFTTESSASVLKARKPGWHRCEAEYQIRNRTCNLLVMRAMVYGEKMTESSQTRNIIIAVVVSVVGTVIAVCVLIVVLAYCCDKEDATGDTNAPMDMKTQEEIELLNHLLVEEVTVNADSSKDAMVESQLSQDGQHLAAINGMTVLGPEIFISRKKCQDIDIYDTSTFGFIRQLEVIGMSDPENIVSCSIYSCIYAFDWEYRGQFRAILRINPDEGNLIKKWDIEGNGGRLSVASNTNVILNISYDAKLHEYTADGVLIRVINLGFGTGIIEAWHAVVLPNDLLVVCHSGFYGSLHKVCLLSTMASDDSIGRVDYVEIFAKFSGEQKESIKPLSGPMYLSVDAAGSILVSDESTKQAVLLSSDLDKPRILVSEEDGLELPWRSCFDQSTGQWFVADYNCVLVCCITDEGVQRKRHQLIRH